MQSTRQRILEILKEKNQATVEQLSKALDLTPVTIRHHLDVLRGEGLVDAPRVIRRPGPGRPQYAYALTEAAGDFFPKNYHNLADLMFDEIRERLPQEELEQIIHGIADRMAAEAPSIRHRQRPQDVMNAVVHYLNDKGYVARWEKTPEGGYWLHTCNCPYERVAAAHSELCQMDTNLVARLVGSNPQRISHIAHGDESCSYVFQFETKSKSG